MDSISLLRAVREVIADDPEIRTQMESSDATDMLANRLFYKDGVYARKATEEFQYPHLTFKLDRDDAQLRGADDNSLFLEINIVSIVDNSYYIIKLNRIADRLNLMFSDKDGVNAPGALNAKALTFSPDPVNLKVRYVDWVSGISHDDKEQGSERRHKIICLLKFTVGD